MSTITVTNIQATGETASRAVSGVAAAWVISMVLVLLLYGTAKASRGWSIMGQVIIR